MEHFHYEEELASRGEIMVSPEHIQSHSDFINEYERLQKKSLHDASISDQAYQEMGQFLHAWLTAHMGEVKRGFSR